jgi:hypothetical protein
VLWRPGARRRRAGAGGDGARPCLDRRQCPGGGGRAGGGGDAGRRSSRDRRRRCRAAAAPGDGGDGRTGLVGRQAGSTGAQGPRRAPMADGVHPCSGDGRPAAASGTVQPRPRLGGAHGGGRPARGDHRDRPGTHRPAVDRRPDPVAGAGGGAGRRRGRCLRPARGRPGAGRTRDELLDRSADDRFSGLVLHDHRLHVPLLGARLRGSGDALPDPARILGLRLSRPAQPGDRAARLASRVLRLPVSGLHGRDRVQPDRRHAARPLGQTGHGGTGVHVAGDPRPGDRPAVNILQ